MTTVARKEKASPIPQRVSRERQHQLLFEVTEEIRKSTREFTPQVVLDLDGTLLDNRPRTCAIMAQLANLWQKDHPTEAALLNSLDYRELDYLLVDSLEKHGIHDEALLEQALEHWQQHFFKDDYLGHDIPLDGASEFAWKCYDAGATLVYFTGRDLRNMALGSLASLRDCGFPIGVPGTEFVLKPEPSMSDSEFKRSVTPQMRRSGRVVAAFDNEPPNCNIFQDLFPATKIFLLDTQHLPGAPPLDSRVHVIGDFSMG